MKTKLPEKKATATSPKKTARSAPEATKKPSRPSVDAAPRARAAPARRLPVPAKPKAKTPAKPVPRVEPPVPVAPPDDGKRAVVAQIRELEAQLDRLIDEASRRDLSDLDPDDVDDDIEKTRSVGPELLARLTASAAPRVHDPDPEGLNVTQEIESVPDLYDVDEKPAPVVRAPAERPSVSALSSFASLGGGESTVFDTARELLSSDFYLRKWGRLAMRGRSEEVDDFGFDPIYDQKVRALLEFLYTRYFRVETTGIERVPARGRCLLVANHSGTLPLDGVMIKTAVKLEHASPRDLRWLTEDFIFHMPFLGSTMNRLGAVRACQENAERLLAKEQLVAVFPEGVKGVGKLFGERYRLQRFGRGGFIKLCLRTRTPIIPVAVVGAEETNPLLFKVEYLSKALGLPYVPVTPTFPVLGPLGLLPAPTKWQIQFGEPIDFGSYDRDAAEDEILVGKLAERVRATIQGMLDRAVGARKSVFFG
jgi:1-acyl-sn-glycerol-3-phosphate acyltransferase